MDEKVTEIILGNKNVAEAGSSQINVSQTNIDPAKLIEALEKLRVVMNEEHKESKAEEVRPEPKPKKPTTPKMVTTTFRYRWLDTDANRIGLLYQALLRATVNGEPTGWIAKETTPEDFDKLFSGEESTVQIKWIGTKQHLKYLFKVMWERNYISIPHGGKQKWVVVQSHFVDANRRMFADWDKEQDPVVYKNAIETIAEILNADLSLEEVINLRTQ